MVKIIDIHMDSRKRLAIKVPEALVEVGPMMFCTLKPKTYRTTGISRAVELAVEKASQRQMTFDSVVVIRLDGSCIATIPAFAAFSPKETLIERYTTWKNSSTTSSSS